MRSSRVESPKRLWALDADLAGAFDRIAHDHILAQLGTFPARGMVAQWLKMRVRDRTPRDVPSHPPKGGVIVDDRDPPRPLVKAVR